MKKKLLMTIALLCVSLLGVGVQKAWGFYHGDGSATSPYQIYSSEHWNELASDVAKGNSYAGKYFQLVNDITVTTPIGEGTNGNNAKAFSGIFNGNGYTLTFNYTATDDVATAPFRFLKNATIKNLHVNGTITTAYKYAAGLAGRTYGTTLIQGCRVSTVIKSSVAGDGTHGGIVSIKPDWSKANLTIEDCVFDGKILSTGTTATTHCGGFVGYTSYGSLTIKNCIYDPTTPATGEYAVSSEMTFYRFNEQHPGTITLSNCYYTTSMDGAQGKQMHSITIPTEITGITIVPEGEAMDYNASGIIAYEGNQCLKYGDVLYAGEGDKAQLTFTHNYTDSYPEYSVNAPAVLSNRDELYTLTMPDANVQINVKLINVAEGEIPGQGTQSSPYIICTVGNWDAFVEKVNKGDNSYTAAYYKLAANITVTTMAGIFENGNESKRFKGHFDGDGHTLTLSYGTSGSRISENYCAPFRCIEGADIQNLNVEGTIYTASKFAAGIVGHAGSSNTITGCRSSVTINSSVDGDGTHGGLVANIEGGNTTITNCAFTGSLQGSSTSKCGGLVGWTEGGSNAAVSFNSCLFKPSSLTVSSDGSATFSRGTNITLSNCYYTSTLGTTQGTLAYATAPTDIPVVEQTIAGVRFYVARTFVSGLTATNITPYGATISWTVDDDYKPYQVRYRKNYYIDFENGLPEGWTQIDADGDNNTWYVYSSDSGEETRSGSRCMASDSYNGQSGELTPDNWLITPQLDLGGTLSVWLRAYSKSYNDEHFAIYLSTTGNAKDDFTIVLVPETQVTGEYQQYTADLSSYAGQKGYIAIRHFNCTDQYRLLLDDFEIIHPDSEGWTTVDNANAAGTTITGLEPLTTYEYQVGYTVDSKMFYSPANHLTTTNNEVTPTDLAVANVTANTATINWTAYASSYNLRYRKLENETAKVTLNVPSNLWDDDTGYQMLLDANANTYGSVIPESGALTSNGASAETYGNFEYKIPENADGALDTENIVLNGSVTIEIPADTYDWCITNPTPGDRVWIASENGNIGGRADDFKFEAGMHYTFTVTLDGNGNNDCVNMTVEDIGGDSEWTTVSNISGTSCTLSGLLPSSHYAVQVQSAAGGWQSEWSYVSFTTTDATSIGLANNADNTQVITENANKKVNVTLADRTLYKDGSWNTLCLPFDVTDSNINNDIAFEGTPLEGATAMGYDHSDFDTATGTLKLTFAPIWSVEAGTPFLVKWSSGEPLVNPQFKNVTIKNVATETTGSDTYADFTGSFSPVSLEANNKSVLYLGANNKLYYPSANMTVGSCRAVFRLKGITAGNLPHQARAFVLNFGDGEASAVTTPLFEGREAEGEAYTLDGRRLNGMPTAKGLYIVNGKKVLIK